MSISNQQIESIAELAEVGGDANYTPNIQAPQYQFDQLHSIMKDTHSIVESKTIIKEEKVLKLEEIFNELEKKDKNELQKIFNFDSFKLIHKCINDCRTGIEKIFLDFIELIARRGVQTYYSTFNDFQSSGLLNKIEQMIKEKIEEEKDEKKYSFQIEQLIRIHIQIMKGRKSDQSMLDIYYKVINKNINNIQIIINQLKVQHQKGNMNDMNNEETEREFKQSSQLIQVISIIEYKDEYPYHLTSLMKYRICPLIHLNCPTEINCQQCIKVSQSPAIKQLKYAIFQSLGQVQLISITFRYHLIYDHNFILHIIHNIIQFASQSQHDKGLFSIEQNNQQLQESSSQHLFILSSMHILWEIIWDNKNKIDNNTPKLLHSLAFLANYKLNIHYNQELDEQTLQVRNRCRNCFNNIYNKGDASDQLELVTIGYPRACVIAFSTGGGIGEQDDNQIFSILNDIFAFIHSLHQGRDYKNITVPQLPLQPQLAKKADEQIEEEGGTEELEAQLINIGKNVNVQFWAFRFKGEILSYFLHWSNPKPRWYDSYI